MVIWTGFGILVPIIFILGYVGGGSLQTSIIGDAHNSGAANICISFGLALSSITCWYLHNFLVEKGAKTLLDKETGEDVLFIPSHSLYFIPMHWRGVIGAVITSLFLLHGLKTLLGF